MDGKSNGGFTYPPVIPEKVKRGEKVIKTLPAIERQRPGVDCRTKKGAQYIITQAPGPKFSLWKVVEGGYVKVKTGKSPYELYPLIPDFI